MLPCMTRDPSMLLQEGDADSVLPRDLCIVSGLAQDEINVKVAFRSLDVRQALCQTWRVQDARFDLKFDIEKEGENRERERKRRGGEKIKMVECK